MLVSVMRVSHFLTPGGHGCLTLVFVSIPFGSIYHGRIFVPRQNGPNAYSDANNILGI